ncbi:CoA-acylating methylmalonate-semialdehyde dehydrogenase [candidate division KSB1 bacterium]|nr:MAG: CoA-acylating methylmalonate-semialdehyde dehydrogenase [candidate division KSB1 bacterium]
MANRSQYTCTHIVNGEAIDTSETFFEHLNPNTATVLTRVPLASPELVNQAVQAAKAAFAEWANTPIVKRSQIFYRYKRLFEDQFAALAQLLSTEHGKNVNEAKGSLRRGLEVIELACSLPAVYKGETLRNVGGGVDYETHRFPLGVCVGITPFNFPAMIPLWMFPISVMAGNTFILKPSPQTPLTSTRLVELAGEAGLPPGVLNIVHGGKEVVDALLTHPDIQAISFVGSTPVARYIYQQGTNAGKRVQASGGAKNYALVMPDAPIDNTVNALISSVFGSIGERCMATSVVIGTDAAIDRILPSLKNVAQQLTLGRTDGQNIPDIGPVVSKEHQERIEGYIQKGVDEGAELILDGRNPFVADAPNGFFVGPTIFDRVAPDMTIAQEEIFGPVLSIIRVNSLQNAIAQINKSPFGNAVVVYTNSGRSAREIQDKAECGMVGINVGVPAPMSLFPFSGWKQSFFGDLHVQSSEGLDFCTKKKVVMKRWFDDDQLNDIVF